MSENTNNYSINYQRYYTSKRLIRGLLSNDFFSQNSNLPSFLTFTRPVGMRRVQIFNNYPAKSRGISSDTWPTRP